MLTVHQLMLLCMAKPGHCMDVLGRDVSKLVGEQVGPAPYACFDPKWDNCNWYAMRDPTGPEMGRFFDTPEAWIAYMDEAIHRYRKLHPIPTE